MGVHFPAISNFRREAGFSFPTAIQLLEATWKLIADKALAEKIELWVTPGVRSSGMVLLQRRRKVSRKVRRCLVAFFPVFLAQSHT
jgi:hypothetical protein